MYRLITKHPASKHSATKDKNKEWMRVLCGLGRETSLTIAVKKAVQRSDGTDTTCLVQKTVVVNMKPKMEVCARCAVVIPSGWRFYIAMRKI